jgi:hypothetical protein
MSSGERIDSMANDNDFSGIPKSSLSNRNQPQVVDITVSPSSLVPPPSPTTPTFTTPPHEVQPVTPKILRGDRTSERYANVTCNSPILRTTTARSKLTSEGHVSRSDSEKHYFQPQKLRKKIT